MAPESRYGDFTIILPTLNEAENIPKMVSELSRLYPGSRILIVDDGSKDGMVEKVKEIQKSNALLSIIERDPSDKGLTASVMEGIAETITPYFIVMDADFQHPPETVGKMMEKLASGEEIVVAVRNNIRNMTHSRKMASWGAHHLALLYLGAHMRPRSHDIMSGFFGMKTELAQKIIMEDGDRFERHGFKVLFDLLKFSPRNVKLGEVRFDFGIRRAGESKLNSNIILSLLRQCGMGGKGIASLFGFVLYNKIGRIVAPVVVFLFSVAIILLASHH